MTSYLKHGLELFGATGMIGGMLAAVYLSSTAHPPLYGRVAGFAVAIGLALVIAHAWLYGPDSDGETEFQEEPAFKALGVVAAFIGLLLFPAGLLTGTDYQLVSVSGFGLFVTGVVMVGISEQWETSESTSNVPDDPTEMLDNEDET